MSVEEENKQLKESREFLLKKNSDLRLQLQQANLIINITNYEYIPNDMIKNYKRKYLKEKK